MNPDLVYLAQTDTTAGFLSQNRDALAAAKGRDPRKPFLMSLSSFTKQKQYTRVPKKYRREIRRAHRVTWLYPNRKAIRVVSEGEHHHFLEKFTFMYSTSANAHGKKFDEAYARQKADVITQDARGFFEGEPSAIYRVGKRKKIRLR